MGEYMRSSKRAENCVVAEFSANQSSSGSQQADNMIKVLEISQERVCVQGGTKALLTVLRSSFSNGEEHQVK